MLRTVKVRPPPALMSPKEYVHVVSGFADENNVEGYKCHPGVIPTLEKPMSNLVPRFNKG